MGYRSDPILLALVSSSSSPDEPRCRATDGLRRCRYASQVTSSPRALTLYSVVTRNSGRHPVFRHASRPGVKNQDHHLSRHRATTALACLWKGQKSPQHPFGHFLGPPFHLRYCVPPKALNSPPTRWCHRRAHDASITTRRLALSAILQLTVLSYVSGKKSSDERRQTIGPRPRYPRQPAPEPIHSSLRSIHPPPRELSRTK